MAANSMPWFRVYSELLDDKKIKRVMRSTGECKALIVGVWICLLSLANDSDERGHLSISQNIPYTINDLVDETGLTADILQNIIDEFIALDMLEICDETLVISNWNDRQFKSDNSTERCRKLRENKAKEKRNDDATLQQRSCVVIDTDTESDTDTELTTTTTAQPAPKNVFRTYEQEMGVITNHIAERLKADIEDYSEEWLIDAILIASRAQVRNLPYVESILSRWKTDGKDAGKKTRVNNKSPVGNRKIDQVQSVEEYNKKIIEDIANGTY